MRPFPLEAMGGEAAPRAVLEQEWWLAALQEPRAAFEPWHGDSWPTTTLPAFEVAWCAALQNDALSRNFDLRVRRAFFAESRDIGQPEVLCEIAQETDLDVGQLRWELKHGAARSALLEVARRWRDAAALSW
jgi:predicted DsbA family dithiol-disulfide isomerase